MYRISETVGMPHTDFVAPDFLRDHNSADLLGSASFLSWARVQGLMSDSTSINQSTVAEYCVEYASAPNPWPRGVLDGDQAFAELLSCVPGGNYTWAHTPTYQAVDNET